MWVGGRGADGRGGRGGWDVRLVVAVVVWLFGRTGFTGARCITVVRGFLFSSMDLKICAAVGPLLGSAGAGVAHLLPVLGPPTWWWVIG